MGSSVASATDNNAADGTEHCSSYSSGEQGGTGDGEHPTAYPTHADSNSHGGCPN